MTLRETDITPRDRDEQCPTSCQEAQEGCTLGPDIIRREDYADLEVDAKVELIRSLVPLGLMHVEGARRGGDGAPANGGTPSLGGSGGAACREIPCGHAARMARVR